MSNSDRRLTRLKQIRMESLEERLSFLREQYDAIDSALATTLDAIDNVRLRRQLQYVEEDIRLVSAELEKLKGETLEQFEQLNRGDDISANKLDILRELNLGRIIAEQDDLLEACFIPTVALREVVSEKADFSSRH